MKGLIFLIVIFYLFSAIFISIGLYKMFVYERPEEELLSPAKNFYVEGDAYNYMINTGYAVAYFVLAGVFSILAFTCISAYNNFKMEDILLYETNINANTDKDVAI